MNPLHFAACCVFAVATIGTLKSLSTRQNKVETQRLMKETDFKVRAAQRKLIEGLEVVHWKVIMDYTEERDLESVVCHGAISESLEDFLTIGVRVVGQSFMKQYAKQHMIALEDIAWEVAPAEDEARRLMKQEPRSASIAQIGQPRKLGDFVGVKHFDGRCTTCNPRNDLNHDDEMRGNLRYDPTTHPAYLSGILSRFLKDQVKKHCIPDLVHLVFEMAEEEQSR